MQMKHKKVFTGLQFELEHEIAMYKLFQESVDIKDTPVADIMWKNKAITKTLTQESAKSMLDELTYFVRLGHESLHNEKEPVNKPKSFDSMIAYLKHMRDEKLQAIERMKRIIIDPSRSIKTAKDFIKGYTYYIEKLNDPEFVVTFPDVLPRP